MFSMQSVILNPLIATFQLSSAASLNLGGGGGGGLSQNGILVNGLTYLQFRLHLNTRQDSSLSVHGNFGIFGRLLLTTKFTMYGWTGSIQGIIKNDIRKDLDFAHQCPVVPNTCTCIKIL